MIVGLMGYARSGKDTVAEMMGEFGFVRVAFADTMRDMLYALNPIAYVTSTFDGPEWERVADVVNQLGWDGAKTSEPEIRELLQRLGTEAGRNILGEDIWVNTAMSRVSERRLDRTVISDVRFPNEFDAIIKAGGEVWRIIRPGTEPVNNHPSESALDGYVATRTINNDGDLEQLRARVARNASTVRPAA